LGDATAASGLVARAAEALGRVDILVNNAGVTRDQLAVRMSDRDWSDVLAVDLTAAFCLCRAALRGMLRARWGRIVNVSSIAAAVAFLAAPEAAYINGHVLHVDGGLAA